MAEVGGQGSVSNDKYWLYTWTGLGNSDTGKPVARSKFSDKTASIDGTFSTGGEVTMEGSHDGSTWFTLTDTQGNVAVVTTAGSVLLAENPKFVRPNVTGGDGSTSLNVRIGAGALA